DLGEVQRDLSECLDGVDVEGHAEFGGRLADLAKRLQGADLIVRGHDADERRGLRVPAQFGKGRLEVEASGRVDLEVYDLGAEVGQPVDGVEHGMVFDPRRQHPGSGGSVERAVVAGQVEALEGEIVRLGASGGEDDLRGGGGTARAGDVLTRFFDAHACG